MHKPQERSNMLPLSLSFTNTHYKSNVKQQQNAQTDATSLEQNTILYISGIPDTMTFPVLCQLFSNIGELTSCNLIRKKTSGRKQMMAYVSYKNQEDAQAAILALNDKCCISTKLKVAIAYPRSEITRGTNLHIYDFPKEMSISDFHQLFCPYGKIIKISFLSGLSEGTLSIRFHRRKEAMCAIGALNGTVLKSGASKMNVELAANNHNPGQKKKPKRSGWIVHVRNLTPVTTKTQLTELFSQFGKVRALEITHDFRNNKSFGVVTMQRFDDAVTAIASLNGLALEHEILEVRF